MVLVVVSKVDIPPRTDLDELIKDGRFRVIWVPETVVVDGAVTSVDQLSDGHNRVAILPASRSRSPGSRANEQEGSGSCGTWGDEERSLMGPQRPVFLAADQQLGEDRDNENGRPSALGG
jgi:hypothetical protein